jgi:hypothetical protein
MQIRNESDDVYWKVGNKAFYSKLLAIDDAHVSNKKLEFCFYDRWLSDNMSMDITNAMDWDSVLLDRAMEIRDKWDHVRLWYSGGRDSHLILQTFIKHNIPIDELVVIDFNYAAAEYRYIYDYLIDNPPVCVKKITKIVHDEKSHKEIFAKNWHMKDENTTFNALPPVSAMINQFYPEKYDWCNVTGAEKPRVICEDGKMYASMNDGTVQTLIGINNHEPFYVSPGVPIFQYQTWNLVNYINTHLKNVPDHDLNMGLNTIPKNPWDHTSLYYHGCRGALRTEFAAYELGLPLGKAFQSEFALKIGLARYADIENTWQKFYPEINRQFRNGMLQLDEAYNAFHQGGDTKYQPLKVHSMRHYLQDRVLT